MSSNSRKMDRPHGLCQTSERNTARGKKTFKGLFLTLCTDGRFMMPESSSFDLVRKMRCGRAHACMDGDHMFIQQMCGVSEDGKMPPSFLTNFPSLFYFSPFSLFFLPPVSFSRSSTPTRKCDVVLFSVFEFRDFSSSLLLLLPFRMLQNMRSGTMAKTHKRTCESKTLCPNGRIMARSAIGIWNDKRWCIIVGKRHCLPYILLPKVAEYQRD